MMRKTLTAFLSVILALTATMGCTNGGSSQSSSDVSSTSFSSESTFSSYSSDSSSSSSEQTAQPLTLYYELSNDRAYYILTGWSGEAVDVVIPDEYNGLPVKEIAEHLFYGCMTLRSVTVGANVEYILSGAFARCFNLTTVTLGASVVHMDYQCFLYCEELTEITIPASVRFIGSSAFKYCARLKRAVFEIKTGWTTSSKDVINAEDLEDARQAATLLTDTYHSKAWRREDVAAE